MSARFDVAVHLGPRFDIWLNSYFMLGLMALDRQGHIRLSRMGRQESRRWDMVQGEDYPIFIASVKPLGSGGPGRILCFDPKDQSDVWQAGCLSAVDYYFKRDMYEPDMVMLPEGLQRKVRPLNPMFAAWSRESACWSGRTWLHFFRQFAWNVSRDGSVGDACRRMKRDILAFSALSDISEYEESVSVAKRKQVLFQTRLWDPALEEGDWVEDCNRQRVELVRALREGLGDQFIGGLSFTPYARKHYPELLSNLTPNAKCRRPEFIKLCREFLIRVNIRALFDAIPYSLGESLAANSCIVSHRVRNACAVDLMEGEHYLGFSTPEECVERCKQLLSRPEQVESLREKTESYYRENVKPEAAMMACLKEAMEDSE